MKLNDSNEELWFKVELGLIQCVNKFVQGRSGVVLVFSLALKARDYSVNLTDFVHQHGDGNGAHQEVDY